MTNALRSPGACLDVRIDDETRADVVAREALLDAAFGPARFRKTCERLRVGRTPARGLALAARAGDQFVGTVRLWHVQAAGADALMLGPLAVAESHRGLGIGDALVREAIARATALGHRAIILVGDAPYYAKFGFSRELVVRLAMPGPVELDRFLGLELFPNALAEARGRIVATGLRMGRRPAAAGKGMKRDACATWARVGASPSLLWR